MDDILAKASSQAMLFAIRSGISIASGFAIKTVSKFLDRIPASEKARLEAAKAKLQTKITILSTSIELIKLSAARGNSVLDATVDLVTDLKLEIDQFDVQLVQIIEDLSNLNEKESVKYVERSINNLLESINDAIPLINLSLVTCGVNLSAALNPRISPSRLLQASHHINVANDSYDSNSAASSVVGPVFDLKMFSIFYNPSRLKYVETEDQSAQDAEARAITWKEDYARASCYIDRVKMPGYHYELVIREDFNDGRYHDDEDRPSEKRIKLGSIRKLFFSASGKLLRFEDSDSPVLTLKVSSESGFDYIALGAPDLSFDDDDDESSESDYGDAVETQPSEKSTTLSLLEYLLRLSALQQNEQVPLLKIKDEKLALYLHDEVDDSVVPQSRNEKEAAAVEKTRKGAALLLESSTNRLEKLSLDK